MVAHRISFGMFAALIASPILFGTAASADDLPLDCFGGAVQGGIVLCQTAPNATIEVNNTVTTRADAAGRVTLGVGRDAEGVLNVQAISGSATSAPVALPIGDIDYAFSVVEGLDCSKVSVFTEEQLTTIRAATAKKNEAVTVFNDGAGAHEGFRLPAEGRRSSLFGGRRRLTGVQTGGETCSKVRTHWGLDIAAPEGTPVIAPADGVITLADELYFEGNAIFLDHGHGVQSVFMHLNSLGVEPGQAVAAGDVIGTIGMTGTATGPHLHWGIKIRNPASDNRGADFYIDPALALEIAAAD